MPGLSPSHCWSLCSPSASAYPGFLSCSVIRVCWGSGQAERSAVPFMLVGVAYGTNNECKQIIKVSYDAIGILSGRGN